MHLLPAVTKTYGWQTDKFYMEAMQIMTYMGLAEHKWR